LTEEEASLTVYINGALARQLVNVEGPEGGGGREREANVSRIALTSGQAPEEGASS
jgi:hypothetical protein